MSDGYYGGYNNQMPPPQPPSSLVGKRPRSDYDVPSGQHMAGYYSREDERASQQQVRATEPINQSYNHYLLSGQNPYPGTEPSRLHSSGHPVDDPRIIGDHRMGIDPRYGNDPRMVNDPRIVSDPRMGSVMDPGMPVKGHGSHLVSGYKEVRLVTKESRRAGGDPLVLCFVDFLSPPHAATALNALQGYTFDETDRDSASIRLQYARFPGARSGGGRRGKR